MNPVSSHKDSSSHSLSETELLQKEVERLQTENQRLKDSSQELLLQQELLTFGEEITRTASWIWNPKDNSLTYSDQLLHMYEFEKEEITRDNIVQKILERIHPDDRSIIPREFKQKYNPNLLPFEFHFRAFMPDKEVKWIRVKTANILENGTVVGVAQDITLNKQIDSLKSAQKLLIEGEKAANMGSFIWNTTTNKITYSLGLLHVLDMNEEEVSPETLMSHLYKRIYPEDMHIFQDAVKNSVGCKNWFEKEYRILDRHSDIRYIRSRCMQYQMPHLVIGMLSDISTEKEIEERVNQIQNKLHRQRKLMLQGEELAQLATYTQYLDTEEVEVSPTFLEIFEIPVDKSRNPELLPYFYSLVHPEDLPSVKEYAQRKHALYKENAIITIEYRVLLPGNRVKWVLSRTIAGDKPNIVLGTMQDITEAKTFNLMLEETQQEIETFIYTISHDLRAPVRHILSYSQWIELKQADKLDDKGKNILQYVIKAAERMGKMVDKLLDYSRTRNLIPHLRIVKLDKLVKELIPKLTSEPGLPYIQWNIEPLPNIFADQEMTQQVFENLLSNAIKFSSKKEAIQIKLSVAVKEDMYEFAIKDNGVGFDPQYQHKLFGIFQRLHNENEFPGSGIGLASVQRIIHLHGGEIKAESKPKEGATFIFTFPMP
ncbi:MAG: ATP-binding protein [Bacteroidota bacterium]